MILRFRQIRWRYQEEYLNFYYKYIVKINANCLRRDGGHKRNQKNSNLERKEVNNNPWYKNVAESLYPFAI